MNKKQLIAAWIMGILLSVIAFNVAVDGYYFKLDINFLFKYGLPVIIIGGLSIYTLRDRKN